MPARFSSVKVVCWCLVVLLILGGSSWAAANAGQHPSGVDTPLLNINAGQIALDSDFRRRWRYGVEYRMAPVSRYRLVPSFGMFWVTNDSHFLYLEARKDIRLGEQWLLTPSFGGGRFNNKESLDLGKLLEFRSGLELSYRFAEGHRLGVAIFHLSNGGLSTRNPGVEALVASFSIPLGRP